MPANKNLALAAIVSCALLSIGAATAVEPQFANAADAPAPAEVPGLGPRLDAASLDALRGGDDSVENRVDIHGQVDGNSVQNTVSGGNTLAGDAFANASGIATVIQNTGSNVLIQNGMTVNVQFAGSGP